jgi:rod shape-determining protein MreD
VKYVIAFVTAGFLALLQVSAMSSIEVLGVVPDLVLILAASWAVTRGQDEAAVVVPMAGFLRDLLTSDPLGTSALALVPIVLLAAAVRLRAVDTEFVPTVLVVALGTLTYGIISMTVLALTGQTVDWTDAALRIILPSCLVNAVFTPLVYGPVHMFSAPQREKTIGTRRLTSPL